MHLVGYSCGNTVHCVQTANFQWLTLVGLCPKVPLGFIGFYRLVVLVLSKESALKSVPYNYTDALIPGSIYIYIHSSVTVDYLDNGHEIS